MAQLDAHRNGLLLLEAFWGAWLLPFGSLVFKCGRLPRLLGVLLMLGGLGYLTEFLGTLLAPAYAGSAIASYIILPAAVGDRHLPVAAGHGRERRLDSPRRLWPEVDANTDETWTPHPWTTSGFPSGGSSPHCGPA